MQTTDRLIYTELCATVHNRTCTINNGNRTKWNLIRSVIIRVITKSDDRAAGVRFVNHEYNYRLNWTTRCPVTNLSKLWQNSRNQQSIDWALNDFKTLLWMLKNPAVYSTKCTTTARAKWRVLSNYKHDVYNCPISIGNRSIRETIRD